MLEINKLFVTQHLLRYLDQIPQMVEFVKKEGFWNVRALTEHANTCHPGRVSPLIQISRFPDGQDFIHDGHHRLVTTWMAGRRVLFPEEYEIINWTYLEYLEVNLAAGWFTPFDPRTHCRKPELQEFKKKIRSMVGVVDDAKIEATCHFSHVLYCEPRRFNTIAEMVLEQGKL